MLHTDFAIVDHSGRPVAAVEVKNRRGTSRTWATGLWRNLLAHEQSFDPLPYFLLVTRDRLYLWRNPAERRSAEPPDFEADLDPILRPYFEKLALESETISGLAFDLLIAAWLSDLTRLEDPSLGPRALVESGLLASIQNGRLDYSVAA